MRKTLFIYLITISGYCSANDYFDKKYYSDVYCLKLKDYSKKIAYDRPKLEEPNNEAALEALEAVKNAKKEVIKAMSDIEITDDQREDILHVIDIVYDNNYYYINEYFENTYRYCIDKYITKR